MQLALSVLSLHLLIPYIIVSELVERKDRGYATPLQKGLYDFVHSRCTLRPCNGSVTNFMDISLA